MYDIIHPSLQDLMECSRALRTAGKNAVSMEDIAQQIATHIHENVGDKFTGEKGSVLMRLFKTHPYDDLPKDL